MLKDYIAKRKLDMIRYYMQDLELSLDEVIEKTGFNSRSYFHRFIKKETNMTPKAFRIKILCEKPE
jgi:AraC-like DNA-binding protein